MKIALITSHDALSARKTGFHFWADILARRGHAVRWLTAGYSPLTLLKKNNRRHARPYNCWVEAMPGILRYVWFSPFHPFNLYNDFANRVAEPVLTLYPFLLPPSVIRELKDADIIIVENGPGLNLIRRIKSFNPHATIIYNYSDTHTVLGSPPVIVKAEKKALPLIDKIRINSPAFRSDFPADAPAVYIPQSIDKAAFDTPCANPYATPRNAISVGDMLFDAGVIEAMAAAFPDWHFHLFGRKAFLEENLSNVIAYGERPFAEIVPYMVHADIGLAPYSPDPNASYLSQSSLKMVQYTYCRLPIVAPDFAAAGRAHVLGYDSSDRFNSAPKAFLKAVSFDRSLIDRSAVMSWEDNLNQILDGRL